MKKVDALQTANDNQKDTIHNLQAKIKELKQENKQLKEDLWEYINEKACGPLA